MVTAEREGFFCRLVNDAFQPGLIGVAELFVELAQNLFRALDQIVVVQDQVAGRWMRVQILERVSILSNRNAVDRTGLESRSPWT